MTDAIKWDQPELIDESIRKAAKLYRPWEIGQQGFVFGARWMLHEFRNKPEAEPAPSKELWRRIVRLVQDMSWMGEHLTHERYHYEEARAILAELEPKPDPLDEIMREAGVGRGVREEISAKMNERGIELGEAK